MGFIGQLENQGRLKLGGGGDDYDAGIAGIEKKKAEVLNMLQEHEKSRLDAIRSRYVDKLELRKQARYRENADKEFVQVRPTKLSVLNEKLLKERRN